MVSDRQEFRVGAVSYLNTVPLAWGMLHGPQRNEVDLSFLVPSACAAEVERGALDIGLVPVAEIARQDLAILPGVCISCSGPVRSILLFSRVPWTKVQTVAVDAASRTSVQLTKVILRERFGVEADLHPEQPNLDLMLAHSDAALVIGDPALRLEPDRLPFEHLDLGEQWFELTNLPMVFAAWAGKHGIDAERLTPITVGSYLFGVESLDAMISAEHRRRGVSRELASRYLRNHIRYEFGSAEWRGLEAFWELSRPAEPALASKI